MNTRRLFSESNIGGHNYLSNMVHLPFYLQNSGLRKVKLAQQTSQVHRKAASAWTENEESLSNFLARSVSVYFMCTFEKQWNNFSRRVADCPVKAL
jgi:ankyrin repeat-rich membrane spanning protein